MNFTETEVSAETSALLGSAAGYFVEDGVSAC